MKKQQSGFTLVEIAIVLVIIGLLLGGVLKGQELINNAKVKNLANDFRSISTFIYAYQDRFRALPGDDLAANTHVNGGTVATSPSAPAARGNARIEGAWNSAVATDESFLFWQHVRLANLATGPTNTGAADFLPRNSEGGRIGVTGGPILNNAAPVGGAYAASFYVCSDGIQGRFARQLDVTLDDGNTQTGALRVITNGAANDGDATLLTPATDGNLYTVCIAY